MIAHCAWCKRELKIDARRRAEFADCEYCGKPNMVNRVEMVQPSFIPGMGEKKKSQCCLKKGQQ